jgi:hypothetical protein
LVNPPVYKRSHPLRSSADDKVVETVLGYANYTTIPKTVTLNVYRPPAETQKRLEDLADSTGRVIDQFNVRKYFSVLEPRLTTVV